MNLSDQTSGSPPEVHPLVKEAKSKGKSPTKTWKEVSTTKARLKLMRSMKEEAQGFIHDENFVRKMKSQDKGSQFQGKDEKKVIKMILGLKIEDQRKELRRMKERKSEVRTELINRFGKKTMKFKKVMTSLNRLGRKLEHQHSDHFESKLHHLRRKHINARRERDAVMKPYSLKWKDKYEGVDVYTEEEDPEAFKLLLQEVDREHMEEQVMVIGDMDLGSLEKALLKLPPGTSINPKLTEKEFKCENEVLNVKLRFEQRKWEEQDQLYDEGLETYKWVDLGEVEKVRRAEEEASIRQIYDPINNILNFSKKRVTDSALNSYVKVPKELTAEKETYIDLRRNRYRSVLQSRIDALNNNSSNLPPQEAKGLCTLQEKVKDGELLVLKTDKSGKLVPCSQDAYMEMGKVHFSKDREVNIEKVRNLSDEVAAHTSCWLKMFTVGESHGQASRFRKSFIGGDSPAPMYCLVKDHKGLDANGLPKTRPVVSGCSSYNVGLSELCSEVLEAVFKSMKNKVGVISSDDFLAKLHKLNNTVNSEGLKIYNPEVTEHVQGQEDKDHHDDCL